MLVDGKLQIPVARAFMPLLRPARYKGARGGRGSGKSYFIADQMIGDCLRAHHRVACLREFQVSIKASTKQTLEDRIHHFGLDDKFRILEQEIVGPHDSPFIFKGLDGSSADSLKSLEGFDRAWVAEAQRISLRSLSLFTPTFRANGAEMYFDWNPVAEDDPVEQLFIQNLGDADFSLVTVDYRDNPWFPEGLKRDMERDRVRDPEKYAHIWLGDYQRKSQARVFHNWRIEEFDEPPCGTRLYYGADWGFSIDPTVLVRCWLQGKTLYVDHEAYRVGCEIDATPALFDTVPGARRWPIRADSARPETISYMKRAGFNISPATKGPNSVEDGIEFLKSCDIVVHPRCRRTADELSRYSWKVDKRTDEVLPVLEDKDNHVCDSLRYSLEGARLAAQTPVISHDVLVNASLRPGQRWPTPGERPQPSPILQPPARPGAGAGLPISAALMANARANRIRYL